MYNLSKNKDANSESNNNSDAVDAAEASRRARAIYERGVIAVRYSVDMWVKYCEFLIGTVRVPVDEARM